MRNGALGLAANWPQFALLGKQGFHLTWFAVTLAFITSFGFVKAGLNLSAGRLADHYSRKPLLIAGWLVALPVPFMIIAAPTWAWVVTANVLVGVNQGLAWSMTVTGKIDLVGPRRRGLTMGINEFSGYAGVALGGFAGGYLVSRFGLRPAPFVLMLGAILIGLLVSILFVRETVPFARLEAGRAAPESRPSWLTVFLETS